MANLRNLASRIKDFVRQTTPSQFGTTIGTAFNAPFRFNLAQQQQNEAEKRRYQLLAQARQAYDRGQSAQPFINRARAISGAYGSPVQSLQQEYSQPQYSKLGL